MVELRLLLACLLFASGCRSCSDGCARWYEGDLGKKVGGSHERADMWGAVPGQAFTLEPDPPGGLRLRYHGRAIGKLGYCFRRADGSDQARLVEAVARAASGVALAFAIPGPGQKAIPITGMVRTLSATALRFEYRLPSGVAGGAGLCFEFAAPPEHDAPALAVPDIAHDKTGFALVLPGGSPLRVRFSQALPRITVAQPTPLRIEAQFPSRRPIALHMTVTLPQGGTVVPALAQRLGQADAGYQARTLDSWAAPIDLGFLNQGDRPAGQHGRVKVRGPDLYFEDGTRARFWGVNLAAYALFHLPDGAIERAVQRLAAFGFNLVRIHHHDSEWVRPNVFVPGLPNTRSLHEPSLERLDYWVKCLRDAGIYVWLDLEVGRRLRPGDGIPGWKEVLALGRSVKGFNFVNGRIAALMDEFATQYLTHRNHYTGLRYVDDPAVVAVLITNENDLVKHGYQIADAEAFPFHHARFKALAVPFAQRHDLPLPEALQPWEQGPAALVMGALEQRFFRRSTEHVRNLGFVGVIAPGNYWGWSPLSALPSLTEGNVIDVHSYGTDSELGRDPRYVGNFLTWIAGAAVDGKPVTVSEWNTPLPTLDRANTPLFVAATAALQRWDALMVYAYAQDGELRGTGPWDVGTDPALMATMPHAALIYRRGDVASARKHYRLQIKFRDLYGSARGLQPVALRALRTLVPQSRVTLVLPPIPPLGYKPSPARDQAIDVPDLHRSFIPEEQDFVVSDTGQLRWTFGRDARYAIDTPRTQAVLGFLGARQLALSVLNVHIQTTNAVVALSSLDDRLLADSGRMLLSVAAQATVRHQSDRKTDTGYLAQPVLGRVGIRSHRASLQLIPLSPAGQPLGRIAGSRGKDGIHWFDLAGAFATHWYLIVANEP